jgi:hypothetical protein
MKSSGAVNDLFEGDLSDDDQVVYVMQVLRGKMMESDVLVPTGSQQQQRAVLSVTKSD